MPVCAPGTSVAMPANASTPMAVIAQNVERQPNSCPRKVPKGTPSTFAAVRPRRSSAQSTRVSSAGLRGTELTAAGRAPYERARPIHDETLERVLAEAGQQPELAPVVEALHGVALPVAAS